VEILFVSGRATSWPTIPKNDHVGSWKFRGFFSGVSQRLNQREISLSGGDGKTPWDTLVYQGVDQKNSQNYWEDGSEIPFPTTVWIYKTYKTLVNNGSSTTNLPPSTGEFTPGFLVAIN